MAMMSSRLPQMVASCNQLTSAKISLPEDFGEQGVVTLVGRGRARPVDDDGGEPRRLICPERVRECRFRAEAPRQLPAGRDDALHGRGVATGVAARLVKPLDLL